MLIGRLALGLREDVSEDDYPRSAPTAKGAFATGSTVSQVARDYLERVSWQAWELGDQERPE